VLGAHITALGVLRRLARTGVRTYVLSRDLELVRHSRFYRNLPGALDGSSGNLANQLRHAGLDGAVLVPCSDEMLVEVASLPPDLASRFVASIPPRETAVQLVDKAMLARLLGEAGVAHPRTVELRAPEDLDSVDTDTLLRSFIKPTHSQAFAREFNCKGFHVDDLPSAKRQVSETLARGFALVLQEMIPGPASHQMCVDGFVDREGRIRGLFARRWLLKWPRDLGESCLSVSVPLTEVSEAVDLAVRAIRVLRYRGVFSVELKKSEVDGAFRVLEINMRPWWYVGFTCRAGMDVCRMIYLDALGQPVPEAEEYRVPVYSVYPRLEWHARRALPRKDRRVLPTQLRVWLTGVQPIFEWTDPGPAAHDVARRLAERLHSPWR